jgi:hypothetical protein
VLGLYVVYAAVIAAYQLGALAEDDRESYKFDEITLGRRHP